MVVNFRVNHAPLVLTRGNPERCRRMARLPSDLFCFVIDSVVWGEKRVIMRQMLNAIGEEMLGVTFQSKASFCR